MDGPTKVVVYVSGGDIQHILATHPVDAYIVEHDSGSVRQARVEICGLPVLLRRHRNVVAPRLVDRVVSALDKEG